MICTVSQLVTEIGDLVLGVWVRSLGRQPTLNVFRDELRCMFRVGGLVQHLPILSSTEMGDPIQVNATVSQLSEKFRSKHHCRDVSSWDQVKFTSMSQLSTPMIVGLLVE